MRHRVLVTGAAGAVGRAVCAALRSRGHFVRGLDRTGSSPPGDESIEGNIADARTVADAVDGMDTIIHLAAQPDDAPFMEVLLEPNVIGVYRVLEAAREASVRRVVLTSSIQVVGGIPLDESRGPIRVADGTAPLNQYAVTKILAEEWGRMYHLQHGLSIIAARLGWFPRSAESLARARNRKFAQRFYLGHRDAGSFYCKAVEAENVGYALVFVTSRADGKPVYDLTPARDLVGFEPGDDYPAGSDFQSPKPDPFGADL